MRFGFPEDDGNFRVTRGKRIDVIFPLTSAPLTVCQFSQVGPKVFTRYRSLSWFIVHRYPTGYRALGAHEVAASLLLALDSVSVVWDTTLTFEQRYALARDSAFAPFDSAIPLTEDFVLSALRKAKLTIVQSEGEPPRQLGKLAIEPLDIRLHKGRLAFSIQDSSAAQLLMRPDNVSVTMSWCGGLSKISNSQVTIERRP